MRGAELPGQTLIVATAEVPSRLFKVADQRGGKVHVDDRRSIIPAIWQGQIYLGRDVPKIKLQV